MSTGHRPVRLSLEDLQELKHLLVALLALLSFWSLAALDIGSLPLILLALLAAGWVLLFPRSLRRIPATSLRWAPLFLLVVISGDFLLNLPEFIAPLARMVVLLIVYRLFAPRGQREDLQVLLLCLFCIVLSGVLTVSLLFAVQILLFTPLAMGLLFIICLLDRGDSEPLPKPSWDGYSLRRLLRRVFRVLDLRVLVLCGGLFALVVAVSTLLFILTPRFDINQSIPFLQINTEAQSGFTEEVRLGDVSEILANDAVALRIDVPSLEAVAASPYWRMLVLDKYEAGRFQLSRSLRLRPLRQFDNTREIQPERPLRPRLRERQTWTFYMEGGVSRYLPVPGYFQSLRFQQAQDVEIVRWPWVFAIDSVGQNVFSFQLEDLQFNRRFAATEDELAVLQAAPSEPPGEGELAYPLTALELELAEPALSRLRAINASILGAGAPDASRYSQLVTDYLRENFRYSLRPDGERTGDSDPIVGWLESGSQGHCELFAGAFVLLAREAGFPARMVVGFAGGSWNSVEDYFVVRNSDAHAWAEIFDGQTNEWLRVDPTPGSGSSDPEVTTRRTLPFESGWDAWLDSLRIQWYRRVINFEQADQVELATNFKDAIEARAEAVGTKLRAWGDALVARLKQPFSLDAAVVGLGALFASAVLVLIWKGRETWLYQLRRLLRRPPAMHPTRRQARRYLKRAQAKGLEGPVVDDLKALRFGPEESMGAARDTFARARRALRERPAGQRKAPRKEAPVGAGGSDRDRY